jgi:15-cis-phytoene synthase
MIEIVEQLPPPLRLAVAYAPKSARVAFALLLLLDERLAQIVGRATEPMIAQLKLAWWRDAFTAHAGQRPKGEPLLSALFDQARPELLTVASELVDAWEILPGHGEWTDAELNAFAQKRGDAVFNGYCRAAAAGEEWARGDIAARYDAAMPGQSLSHVPLLRGRIFRPLTILTMLSRGVSGPRLILHSLTGL